jgi:hypothetical protein
MIRRTGPPDPRKIARNLNLTFAAFADTGHPSCPQRLKYVLLKLARTERGSTGSHRSMDTG